jgi:hypothetical protein
VVHLAKSFIKQYQGAIHWSKLSLFKRTAGSSCKEVQQQLHNARQACLNDCIPIDDRSWVEHLHYLYQLSLSLAQSAHFLASLSSNPLASDVTLTGEAESRKSQVGPKSSGAQRELFQLRVTLVEVSLNHDNGDGGHGGGVRAAVTTGSPDLPAG